MFLSCICDFGTKQNKVLEHSCIGKLKNVSNSHTQILLLACQSWSSLLTQCTSEFKMGWTMKAKLFFCFWGGRLSGQVSQNLFKAEQELLAVSTHTLCLILFVINRFLGPPLLQIFCRFRANYWSEVSDSGECVISSTARSNLFKWTRFRPFQQFRHSICGHAPLEMWPGWFRAISICVSRHTCVVVKIQVLGLVHDETMAPGHTQRYMLKKEAVVVFLCLAFSSLAFQLFSAGGRISECRICWGRDE